MINKIIFMSRAIKSPGQIGAIIPSSKRLARALAVECLKISKKGKVIELGCGEGVVTYELHRRGLLHEIVELDPVLASIVKNRFEEVKVIVGDAGKVEYNNDCSADTIVSSIPFNSIPRKTGKAILENACACMSKPFYFVQYTYNPRFCISKIDERFTLSERRVVVANIPPAWVLTYMVERA